MVLAKLCMENICGKGISSTSYACTIYKKSLHIRKCKEHGEKKRENALNT